MTKVAKTVPEKAKKQAEKLRWFLATKLARPVQLKVSDSLEAVAVAFYDQPNWNVLTGIAKREAAASPRPGEVPVATPTRYEASVRAQDVEVHEDPDQPGWWYWRRNGNEGSDISFPTQDEAWADAMDNGKPAEANPAAESSVPCPRITLGFAALGEGYNGDYDPEDPEDRELLRLDVEVVHPNGDVEEFSTCTQVGVGASDELRGAWLGHALRYYEAVGRDPRQRTSFKKLTASLSWMGEQWDGTLPKVDEALGLANRLPARPQDPLLGGNTPVFVPRGLSLPVTMLNALSDNGRNAIRAVVPVPLGVLVNNGIEDLNDFVSKAVTGSCAGLQDIGYAVWHDKPAGARIEKDDVLVEVCAIWTREY